MIVVVREGIDGGHDAHPVPHLPRKSPRMFQSFRVVFLRDGLSARLVTPGTYSVTTEGLPLPIGPGLALLVYFFLRFFILCLRLAWSAWNRFLARTLRGTGVVPRRMSIKKWLWVFLSV